jgi:serine/threonine-protein kinase
MMRRIALVLCYGAAVATGLLAAVVAADRVVLPLLVRQGQMVSVPDVTGLTSEEAGRLLERSKLKLVVAGEKYDAVTSRGTLCAQVPSAGTEVKPGRNIRALVSRGTRTMAVPPLAGLPLDHAQVVLEKAGLRTRAVLTSPSTTYPGGTAIASSPAAGETVGTGEMVDLLVSSGSPPTCYVLPDLRGRRIDEVVPLLQRVGLQYQGVTRSGGFSAVPGLILQQQPRPGSTTCQGDTLTLWVAGETGT